MSNTIDQDLTHFKENIYKHIDTSCGLLEKTLNNIKGETDTKLEKFDLDFNSINMKINNIKYLNENDFDKLAKIEELMKFKYNTEANIYNLDSKISNSSTNFKKSCQKYDSIFLQNLDIPGVIGSGKKCIYKDLKEFIIVII